MTQPPTTNLKCNGVAPPFFSNHLVFALQESRLQLYNSPQFVKPQLQTKAYLNCNCYADNLIGEIIQMKAKVSIHGLQEFEWGLQVSRVCSIFFFFQHHYITTLQDEKGFLMNLLCSYDCTATEIL